MWVITLTWVTELNMKTIKNKIWQRWGFQVYSDQKLIHHQMCNESAVCLVVPTHAALYDFIASFILDIQHVPFILCMPPHQTVHWALPETPGLSIQSTLEYELRCFYCTYQFLLWIILCSIFDFQKYSWVVNLSFILKSIEKTASWD